MTALDSVLDRIKVVLNNSVDSLPSNEQQLISGQVQALRCVTAYLVYHDYERAQALGEGALQQLPIAVRDARSLAAIFLAFSQVRLGLGHAAVHQLQKTIVEDPTPLGLAKTQFFIGLCLIHHQAGELRRLGQLSDYFLSFAAASGEANPILGANYTAGLLHYQWNDLKAAALHFSKVVELRYRSNFVGALNAGIGLARIYQAQGKLSRAQEIIHSFYEDTYRLHNTDLLPLLESAQAELQMVDGSIVPALRWAQEFQPETVQDNLFNLEVSLLTQARIIVAYGSEVDLQTVRHYLEQRLADTQQHHFTTRLTQVLAHLSLVYDRLGRSNDAFVALRRALTLGQPDGFVRAFVECGPTMIPFLEQLKREGAFPGYLSQVQAGFGTQPQEEDHAAPRPEQIEPLTRREQEVLQLIQARLTNQEIADKLVISLPTVKRHASNIYGKLAVKKRRHAILKATELGLLSPT